MTLKLENFVSQEELEAILPNLQSKSSLVLEPYDTTELARFRKVYSALDFIHQATVFLNKRSGYRPYRNICNLVR